MEIQKESKMQHRKTQIWPSIMAQSQTELNAQLATAKQVSPVVHLDFVDGRFANNKVLQFPFILKRGLEYSAHLMLQKPLPFIKKHKHRIQLFIPHFEVFADPQKYVSFCKKEQIVTAFAVLPQTNVTKIKTVLRDLDYLLILTVKPGFYGSKFQKSQVKKIAQVKKYIQQHNLHTQIIVDGAMNPEHLTLCKQAGANIFVSGSYLMKSSNVKRAMKELQYAAK